MLQKERSIGLKLTTQILEIVGRTVEKLTTNVIVILKQLVETGERLAQKKNLYFAFVDMEKVFHRVFWDVV